ncbi:uncharacterized protein LOC116846868 isoform X3 [Odontomachus brunneus]|uniref:uncharacterized protein LOC116846868 isoform X3 n=1 Tax=Odontomachus brunneus TaxID=486640 RepID=UPI0013F2A43E|nr:uncharacterized protein LOC116846868 isoform X3 [Odontomachus brunneus]
MIPEAFPESSIIRNPIVNYNNFFNPYVCHVCKSSKNLQECHWCQLISYCCKEHLELHLEQHKEFCLAVISLRDKLYCSHDITLKEWTQLKKANVRRVKYRLGRNLEPYEVQILLFAKSCLKCRRQNNLSIACKACMSVSMCYRHISMAPVHSCTDLRLCAKLDINSISINEKFIPKPVELLNYSYPSDMKEYIQQSLGRSRDFNTWSYADFLYTNYFSRPLTLLFNITTRTDIYKLTSPTTFTIHVIAGIFTDENSLLAWEFFIHQMLPDSSLAILIIGPKVKEYIYNIELCDTCFSQNKKLYFAYIPMTYKRFICAETYKNLEPNIIMGFDIDFENDEAAIRAAMCLSTPLVLTCKSESKAQETVTKIKAKLRKKPIIHERNMFASCRPYRDAESDSVFFPHHYVIIYDNEPNRNKKLDVSSNDNQPSTSNQY